MQAPQSRLPAIEGAPSGRLSDSDRLGTRTTFIASARKGASLQLLLDLEERERERKREKERESERESEREKKIKAFAGKGMGTRVVSVPEEVTTQAGHGAPKMSRLRAGQAGTQAVESIFTHRYEMNPEVASRQAIFSRVARVHQAPLTHGSDHAHLTICGHGAFPLPCCEMSGPTTDNKSDGLVLSAVGYHCTSAYARYQMSHR